MSAQNISEHTKIPVITPGSGNTPPTGERPVRQGALLRVLVLLTLVVLVALAIGVFTVLPRMVAEPPRHAETPATTPDARQPPTSEPSEQALLEQRARAEKRSAEEALGRLLRRQTELEAQRVTLWGGDDYGAVGLQVERADALFADARFEAARASYDEAVAALDELEASKPERLEAALSAGAKALSVGDGESAAEQFAIALGIDPNDAEAQHGAKRAHSIDEVFEHITTALEHEEKQELELARAEFARALELDTEVLPAAQGLARVTDKIDALEFRHSMSEALSAIDNQDFESARRALDKASGIRPDATEVADARRQLDQAYEAAQIRRHERRARDHEQAELWEQAHAEYAAVLAIDTSLHFAQRGARRTSELAALEKEMDKFLREPIRVYDPNAVKHVQSLLEQAGNLSPAGPTLAANTERLQGLLALAETPIAVSLASDNQTHVVVYKVGELGRFTTRTLKLRPGSYVAVGQRIGYRDVRVAINVLPGESAGPFVVRCQERI